MCIDPVTAMTIAAGVKAVGSVVGAVGTLQASEYNAKVAETSAIAERQRAAYDAGIIKGNVNKTIGAQRAATGAAGIVPDTGSAADVTASSLYSGELDILSRVYGGEASALSLENKARSVRAGGRARATGQLINAGTTLLTSGFKGGG